MKNSAFHRYLPRLSKSAGPPDIGGVAFFCNEALLACRYSKSTKLWKFDKVYETSFLCAKFCKDRVLCTGTAPIFRRKLKIEVNISDFRRFAVFRRRRSCDRNFYLIVTILNLK